MKIEIELTQRHHTTAAANNLPPRTKRQLECTNFSEENNYLKVYRDGQVIYSSAPGECRSAEVLDEPTT